MNNLICPKTNTKCEMDCTRHFNCTQETISPLPSNEDELWEEVWDESTYIEDDIDSLQQVAGSCVITHSDFQKIKKKFNITKKP